MGKMYNAETMTLDEFRELIADGDDRFDNQIRVTDTGEIFLSQGVVGNQNLQGIDFRLQTFDAYNDYVGEAASKDDNHVTRMFNAIKSNWSEKVRQSHIDDWMVKDY